MKIRRTFCNTFQELFLFLFFYKSLMQSLDIIGHSLAVDFDLAVRWSQRIETGPWVEE